MDTFSLRLREAMRHRDVRLADVAKALGKSAQTVHKWTKGGDIEHETLKMLADFLGENWVRLRYGEPELINVCDTYPVSLSQSLLADVIDNERRGAEIIEAMDIGIWEFDIVRARIYVNSFTWRMMTGESKAAGWIKGESSTMAACVCEADLAHLAERRNFAVNIAKNGDRFLLRYRAKWRPDVWLLGYGIVAKNANGLLTKIIGFTQEEAYRNAANEYFNQLAQRQEKGRLDGRPDGDTSVD